MQIKARCTHFLTSHHITSAQLSSAVRPTVCVWRVAVWPPRSQEMTSFDTVWVERELREELNQVSLDAYNMENSDTLSPNESNLTNEAITTNKQSEEETSEEKAMSTESKSPDSVQPLRMQGTFVSDAELRKLVRHWRGFNSNNNVSSIETNTKVNESENISVESHQSQDVTAEIETLAKEEDRDELYATAVETVQSQNRASISMLQKHLRIGYTRAAKLIDDLEDSGIVGPAKSGAKQRDVLSKLPDIQPDVDDISTDSIEMVD